MAIHRIKLKDLNAQYIQSLKAQIKDGNKEVAIWISDTTETMTKATF